MTEGFRPKDLSEALKIREKEACILIAGGTDLMVHKARGFGLKPDISLPLLYIGHLQELRQISGRNGEIHIGAGVLLSDLLKNNLIPEPLKKIVSQLASPPTRNIATLGGNICNASPAGDTLPYLYAINAVLVLKNSNAERKIPIREFITAPGKTNLKSDELLTEIIVPDQKFSLNYYRKVGTRKGMSLSKVSFTGLADIENGRITDIRIAFGAVAPTIVRSEEIEKMIIGKTPAETGDIIPDIIGEYSELIRPIDDSRSSAEYRKNVSLKILEEFLNGLR